ncbi:hypothetical protein [uncultured Brevundimonas sp.]|uniref:hypothetical protein n=1 Tax=uncultured Brevundimonas sp. TaxID=213418 RepID=UPI0026102130|nr:hypothetical protein [uncultured Brevundimonas sp.]
MTKKILLTATAFAALAFAGAAAAGDLTTGSNIASEGLIDDGDVVAYVLAKDFALPSAGLTSDGVQFVFDNDTNPIAISSNTDYIVTLTLTGPAKFVGQASTVVTFGGEATSETPILSADGKTLSIYAKTGTVTGTPLLETISASGFNLKVTGQESVSVAYKLQQIAGSQTLDLDSSSAAEVIAFKNALTLYKGTTVSATAALPAFETFQGVSGALTSNNFSSTVAAYNIDLEGTNVPVIADIITGYSATVTGPQVEDMLTSFDGISIEDATAVTAGSATFASETGGAVAFNLVLTPAEDTPISEGSYKVTITPTYATGWTGAASVEKTAVTVGLAGTSFYAPWFGLGGSASNATLRIGNNGSTATGNIVIQLKARNGSTATATSVTFPGVAANSFRSITGAELRQAFGTDASNADLMISIQSDANDKVSAKVRTVQANGNTFESSLDLLTAPVTAASIDALSDDIGAVQTTVDTINANTAP